MSTSAIPAASGASRTGGLILVCAAGVLWGTGGVAVQIIRAHSELSSWTISAYRTGIAALVLLVSVAITRQWGAMHRLAKTSLGRVVVVGAATGAYQALYFASVTLAGVTVSTVVSLGTAPIAIAVLRAVRERRLPSWSTRLQIMAALAGLVMVSFAGHGPATSPDAAAGRALGLIAAVIAGLGFAFATVLGESLAKQHAALALATTSTIAGAALLIPLSLVLGGPVGTTDPVANLTLLYLGAATFALAYGCLYAGLRTTTSSAATLAALLEPVTAAILAIGLLGEQITAVGLFGMLLILAAIAQEGIAGRA